MEKNTDRRAVVDHYNIQNVIQKLQQYLYYSTQQSETFSTSHNNMRFKADKGMEMDALVHLRKKRGAGGRGEANDGESVLATLLWGTPYYADDAGVVSQSPDRVDEEDDGGGRGRMRGV